MSTIPAKLLGYGERWDGDRCILWAEGTRYLAPISDVVWATHVDRSESQGVGYQRVPAPMEGFA